MRPSSRWTLLLVLSSLLTGCELAAGYLATDFGLSLEPASASVARGESRAVTVHVDRILPIDVAPFPIRVTLHRAPDGVTLAEGDGGVDIPSGVSEEIVTLHVADDAELGLHEVVLRGDNFVRTRDATLELAIEAAR